MGSELKLLPAYQIYINNCVIKLPQQFDSRLQRSLARAYEVEEADVVLSERRLRVAAHNQWTFVNSARLGNSIALSAEDDLLRCNGIPTIDSVFVHPRIALIFQLEYSIWIRREGKLDSTTTLTVGEALALLNVNEVTYQFESADLVEPMHSDSERSITGTALWTPDERYYGEDWTLTLACEASVRQGSVAGPSAGEIIAAIEERKKLEETRIRQVGELIEKEAKETAERTQGTVQKSPSLRPLLEGPKIVSPHADTKPKAETKRGTRPNTAVAAGTGKLGGKSAAAIIPTAGGLLTGRNIITEAMGHEISRADQLILAAKGLSDILNYQVFNFEIADIEEDRLDLLKADTVTIEFVSFKPKGLLAADPKTVPRSVAFSLRFFSFPETRTEAVTLRPMGNGIFLLELLSPIKGWTTVTAAAGAGLSPDSANFLRVQYNFDPASDKDISMERQLDDFLRYLAGNLCKVWVYDAESRIPLGSCVVCLSDLLRRRSPTKTVKKEYNVLGEDREPIGSLQLVLQSQGHKAGTLKATRTEPVAVQKPAKLHKGKTRIKSKPLRMEDIAKVPQMSLRIQGDAMGSDHGKSTVLSTEERRQSEIVYAYKLRQAPFESVENHLQGWQKESVLEDAGKYRTVSRTLALAALVGPGGEHVPPVTYTIGETKFCPVMYTSSYRSDTEFSCFVYDPEKRSEMQLVVDPEEWQNCCKREGFQEPPDWGMLAVEKGKFVLHGQDQVQLVMRLRALVPPKERLRSVNITIQNFRSQAPEQVSEVRLLYKDTYYNSCYQFDVPENRSVDLTLVPEIHRSVAAKARFVRCSNPDVEARLQNGLVQLTFVSPASPNDTELYVALYADPYCCETVCVFYVLVRSYTCLDINDVAGKRVLQHISIESTECDCLNFSP